MIGAVTLPTMGAVAAEIPTSGEEQAVRTQAVFEKRLDSIEEEAPLRLRTEEIVHEFAGNTYTLIECESTGYLLYHNDSAIFVESAPGSFLNADGYFKAEVRETRRSTKENRVFAFLQTPCFFRYDRM